MRRQSESPPQTLRGALPYLRPGFILSASIVGSGELIATTIVGAKAGFVLMWFIIFSCRVKVAVQIDFGKHAISSGESTMAALNKLPGPRLGKANWSIWTWLVLMPWRCCRWVAWCWRFKSSFRHCKRCRLTRSPPTPWRLRFRCWCSVAITR